jgi:photosystem II stability/assembly factor-like uncharacterized protein
VVTRSPGWRGFALERVFLSNSERARGAAPSRRHADEAHICCRIMIGFRIIVLAHCVALVLMVTAPARGEPFVDVLDTPAPVSSLADQALLQGIAKAGRRLVAVGQRGDIIVSSDAGATWKQSRVPVGSDLTSVFFVDERNGWAVGHDGVVLHTSDAGDTWELQLTGQRANDLLVVAMERKVAAEPASAEGKRLLEEARRYQAQGADKPFLDIWFSDSRNGYVVGAYNLIFRTADGGKTWESWFDRTENPKFFNLYAIRPAAGALYIVGESGLVLKLDPARQRFRAVPTPYNGSFFGIADADTAVIVFGLRGTVYTSADGGATWSHVDAGLPAAVVAATRHDAHTILLADAAGRIAETVDGGQSFRSVAIRQPMPLTDLVDLGEGRLALVGPRGATIARVVSR